MVHPSCMAMRMCFAPSCVLPDDNLWMCTCGMNCWEWGGGRLFQVSITPQHQTRAEGQSKATGRLPTRGQIQACTCFCPCYRGDAACACAFSCHELTPRCSPQGQKTVFEVPESAKPGGLVFVPLPDVSSPQRATPTGTFKVSPFSIWQNIILVSALTLQQVGLCWGGFELTRVCSSGEVACECQGRNGIRG